LRTGKRKTGGCFKESRQIKTEKIALRFSGKPIKVLGEKTILTEKNLTGKLYGKIIF
jgi:hypothetical protein